MSKNPDGTYTGYVYLLINKINNKTYVGQTTRTIKERVWEHFNKKKSYPISLAIQKYGKENFVWEELTNIIAPSKQELIKLLNKEEILFIEKYDSLCGHKGYNIDKGGGQASYFKKPVCQYDFYFNFVAKYDSAVDADRETGICFGDISKCCNKKTKSAGGFYWCFDGEKIDITNNKKVKNRPVVKYDMHGNQIQIYQCVNDISDDKKLKNRIRNCTNGLCYNVDGYVYRHYGDSFEKYPVTNQDKPIKYKGKTSIINANSKVLKAVDVYDLNGNYLNTYNSMIAASEGTNSSKESISNCCRRKQNTCNNLVFRYHGEAFDTHLKTLQLRNENYAKKIIQYNVFGEKENVFVNIYELSKFIGESVSDIYKQLIGKRYSIRNKIYRFENEEFDKFPVYIFGIEQYSLNGTFIKRWESCIECENSLGFRRGAISKAINRKTSCGNYIFIKYGDDLFSITSTTKEVIKYDINMNIVEKFNTIKEAKENSGYNGDNFKRFLNNNNNLYNGYYWLINENNYCR